MSKYSQLPNEHSGLSRSLLDDVDFDPEFYTLKDLFPHIADGVILDVLELTDNDIERATHHLLEGPPIDGLSSLSLESEDTENLDFKVASLMEMFPHIESFTIKQYLLNNENDLDRAMTDLLSYDTLKDAQEEIRIEAESERKVHPSKTWKTIESDTEELVDLTDLDRKQVKNYLHKNNGNVCKALADIIMNFNKDQEKWAKRGIQQQQDVSTLSSSSNSSSNIPAGGRVQASYSTPLNEKKKSKKSQSYKKELSPYFFNESDPDVRELAEFIFNDKSLVEISWQFIKDAVIFFRGDTSRVIGLCIYFLENGGEKETYVGTTNKPLDYSQLFDTKPRESDFKKVAKRPMLRLAPEDIYNPNKNPHLDPAIAANQPNIEIDLIKYQVALQRFQLRKSKEKSVLDLHRFHVKNAKVTTERALDDWWEDELNARQHRGNAYPGVKAREVTPFTIVTGRGIHSEGGVSKVRASIKAFLKNSSYVFEEHVAKFVVVGKRTV